MHTDPRDAMRIAILPSLVLISLFVAGWSRQQQAARIAVGPEVMVSGPDTMSSYNEYDADIDPSNPNRLMVCAQPFVPDLNERKVTVHMSDDGGKTWRLSLDARPERKGLLIADPICAFAPNGTAVLSSLIQTLEGGTEGAGTWAGFPGGRGQQIHRSTDGGRTWSNPYHIGFIDNQFATVDRTGGKYHGRIYLSGGATGNPFWLIYSADTGKSFQRSELTPSDARWHMDDRSDIHVDGTLLIPYNIPDQGNPNQPNAPRTFTMGLSRSTDGGVHVSLPDTVASRRVLCPRAPNTPPLINPQVAVDRSNGPFRGRIYYMWGEVESLSTATMPGVADRCLPVIVSSDDGGRTWTQSRHFLDVPSRLDPARGPDARLPVMAVNSKGVLGLSWYDRREDPKNHGARQYFTASLDGGETWLPSVPISTKPLALQGPRVFSLVTRGSGGGRRPTRGAGGGTTRAASDIATITIRAEVRGTASGIGGDYGAMVTDTSGAFHPFWVDNRGDAANAGHLFTTRVTVAGAVQRSGSAELAGLENVTSKLELQYHYTKNRWDAGNLNVDVGLVVQNVSTDTIRGPLKLRIVGLRSVSGPVILRDTRAPVAGAVLDLTGSIPTTGLAPGASSRVHEIRLRAGPVPAEMSANGPYGVGALTAKIFGKTRP
jgi:hypothetical protein